MELHRQPLILCELVGLVQDLLGNPGLAHVVQKGTHAQIVELELAQAESFAHRDGEDADVDGVSESIVVVVADGRQPDERDLIVQYLVYDSLYRALDLLDTCRAPHSRALGKLVRDRNATLVGAFCHLLLALLIGQVGFAGCRWVDRNMGDATQRHLLP